MPVIDGLLCGSLGGFLAGNRSPPPVPSICPRFLIRLLITWRSLDQIQTPQPTIVLISQALARDERALSFWSRNPMVVSSASTHGPLEVPNDRKGEKSSDCMERSPFELSGPLKGHREPWAENVHGMSRFDLSERTGESIRPGNTARNRPKNSIFSPFSLVSQYLTTAWRRGWDSNPRDPFGPNGFQDRRFQPLTHPSGTAILRCGRGERKAA